MDRQHDWLEFYAADPRTVDVDTIEKYGSRYSGKSGYPSLQNPLEIPSGRFWVKFHSDGSTVDWGYKFVVFDDSMPLPSDNFAVEDGAADVGTVELDTESVQQLLVLAGAADQKTQEFALSALVNVTTNHGESLLLTSELPSRLAQVLALPSGWHGVLASQLVANVFTPATAPALLDAGIPASVLRCWARMTEADQAISARAVQKVLLASAGKEVDADQPLLRSMLEVLDEANVHQQPQHVELWTATATAIESVAARLSTEAHNVFTDFGLGRIVDMTRHEVPSIQQSALITVASLLRNEDNLLQLKDARDPLAKLFAMLRSPSLDIRSKAFDVITLLASPRQVSWSGRDECAVLERQYQLAELSASVTSTSSEEERDAALERARQNLPFDASELPLSSWDEYAPFDEHQQLLKSSAFLNEEAAFVRGFGECTVVFVPALLVILVLTLVVCLLVGILCPSQCTPL